MARAWITDRTNHTEYQEQVKRAKEAGRKPPGRWRLGWYDPKGAQKTKTFTKKSDAEAKKTEIEASLINRTYLDPKAGKEKIKALSETWLKSRKDLAPGTLKTYRSIIDVHIVPRWGDLAAEVVLTEDIVLWVDDLHDPDADVPSEELEGRRPKARAGKVGASHLRTIVRVFSQILDWAVMTKKIAVNPCAGVPLPRTPPTSHVYLTHKLVDKLAKKVAGLEFKRGDAARLAHMYMTLVLLLAYTGLRWGEVSALKAGRIDLDRQRIHVAEALAEDKRGKLYWTTPKSHEDRYVSFPEFLVPLLALLLPPTGTNPEALVFTSTHGGVLRAANFRNRVFAPACLLAGLPEGMTIHKLRHTAASLAIAAGADVKVLQTMLGHSSAVMTLDHYGHLFPDRLEVVAQALDVDRKRDLALAA